MTERLTRTQLRRGFVPPKRPFHKDGVTEEELEVLLALEPAAETRPRKPVVPPDAAIRDASKAPPKQLEFETEDTEPAPEKREKKT